MTTSERRETYALMAILLLSLAGLGLAFVFGR